MLLGEILTARGAVDPSSLARALDDQLLLTHQRIGSLLVSRGLAAQDDVARALSEQLGVPAVLERHLAARDPALAALVPADYARANVLLPIGRGRNGELIVCARDPRRALIRTLARMVKSDIMLAVAPADAIVALVHAVYGSAPADAEGEIEVDLDTGPIATIRASDLDPFSSGAFTLVGLDDASVTKDPSQSGVVGSSGPGSMSLSRTITSEAPASAMAIVAAAQAARATRTLPPPLAAMIHQQQQRAASPAPEREPQPEPERPPSRRATTPPPLDARTISVDDLDGGWGLAVEPRPAPSLDHRLGDLEHSPTRDAATDVVMAYIATRWISGMIFTVREGAAFGHRGYGTQPSVAAVVAALFPLTAPSMLKAAHDTRAITTEPPVGSASIQDRLIKLLASPEAPAVAPVIVAGRVVGLLAVGDAIINPDEAVTDLGRLAAGLGTAYARILRDTKGRER